MAAKKVKIKEFGLDLEVKNKGMSLDIYNGSIHLGDLRVTKTGLTWCKGRSHTGPKATWEEFIAWMES